MPKLISLNPPLLECGHKFAMTKYKQNPPVIGKDYTCNPCNYKGQGIKSYGLNSLGKKIENRKHD